MLQRIQLPYIKLQDDAEDLKYAHEGDSGMDLYVLAYSSLDDLKTRYDLGDKAMTLLLYPGERFLFYTGLSIILPEYTEAQIRTRSGTGLKGLPVVNSPGTIDSSYEGELGVIIQNIGDVAQEITYKQKLAQLVIAPVIIAEPFQVKSREGAASSRSDAGYGSTGI